MSENWFGIDKPLNDFANAFFRLGTNYHYKRIEKRIEVLQKQKNKNGEYERLKNRKKQLETQSDKSSSSSIDKLYDRKMGWLNRIKQWLVDGV